MKNKPTEPIKNKDLADLISNFQNALKVYTPKQLNDAVLLVLNEKHGPPKQVNYVIKAVSSVYKLPENVILSRNTRGVVQEARMVAYAVLHFDLQMSFRHISLKVFKRLSHGGVTRTCSQFKDLKPDKFTLDKAIIDRYNEVRELTYKHILNSTKQP